MSSLICCLLFPSLLHPVINMLFFLLLLSSFSIFFSRRATRSDILFFSSSLFFSLVLNYSLSHLISLLTSWFSFRMSFISSFVSTFISPSFFSIFSLSVFFSISSNLAVSQIPSFPLLSCLSDLFLFFLFPGTHQHFLGSCEKWRRCRARDFNDVLKRWRMKAGGGAGQDTCCYLLIS
jgi:hypothetical protein